MGCCQSASSQSIRVDKYKPAQSMSTAAQRQALAKGNPKAVTIAQTQARVRPAGKTLPPLKGKSVRKLDIEKKKAMSNGFVIILFLSQNMFARIRECMLQFINFSDLIKLGACGKQFYIETGRKQIIAFFTARNRQKRAGLSLDENGNQQAKMTDSLGASITSQGIAIIDYATAFNTLSTQINVNIDDCASSLYAYKIDHPMMMNPNIIEGTTQSLNGTSWADMNGMPKRQTLPHSQEFGTEGSPDNRSMYSIPKQSVSRDLIIDEGELLGSPMGKNPFVLSGNKEHSKSVRKHERGGAIGETNKEAVGLSTSFKSKISMQQSMEKHASEERAMERQNLFLTPINIVPLVRKSQELLYAEVGQTEPKPRMLQFDKEIDNQCLEIYESKELRNLELSSSASHLDLLKFPSSNVNSPVKKTQLDSAGKESRNRQNNSKLEENGMGSPNESNSSSFANSRQKHQTPQFRMYHQNTPSSNQQQQNQQAITSRLQLGSLELLLGSKSEDSWKAIHHKGGEKVDPNQQLQKENGLLSVRVHTKSNQVLLISPRPQVASEHSIHGVVQNAGHLFKNTEAAALTLREPASRTRMILEEENLLSGDFF